ncbi:MAG: alpha/beta hydrolase-fold protein [Pseudomonadota bacterium]
MRKMLILLCPMLMPFVGVQAIASEPYEMPRTQVVPLKDEANDRQYELYVKLPESYEAKPDKAYPVIYTTDAEWHMDLLSGTTEYLMPDSILVGISWQTDLEGEGLGNRQKFASRFRDYSVAESKNAENQAKYHFGQADKFLAFVRDQVVPYVDRQFRTKPGERAYLGYSLGGQFGAYVLLAAPDTFTHYILGSPALGEASIAFIDSLEAQTAPGQEEVDARVFVSIGEFEADEMATITRLMSVLRRRSETGLSVSWLEVIEGSDHGSAVPETFVRGIKWLQR